MKYIGWYLSGSLDAPKWMSGLIALGWMGLIILSFSRSNMVLLCFASMALGSRITLGLGLTHKRPAGEERKS